MAQLCRIETDVSVGSVARARKVLMSYTIRVQASFTPTDCYYDGFRFAAGYNSVEGIYC